MQASGVIQTWLCTRGYWDALSRIWQSHGHAHCRRPGLNPHGHWAVALARICGIHPAADPFVQHGHLGAHEQTTLVSAPLSRMPAIDPTSHPFHIFAKLGPIHFPEGHHLSNRSTTPLSVSSITSPSQFLTKTPCDYPSGRPFQISQPKFLPYPPARVLPKFYDQPSI